MSDHAVFLDGRGIMNIVDNIGKHHGQADGTLDGSIMGGLMSAGIGLLKWGPKLFTSAGRAEIAGAAGKTFSAAKEKLNKLNPWHSAPSKTVETLGEDANKLAGTKTPGVTPDANIPGAGQSKDALKEAANPVTKQAEKTVEHAAETSMTKVAEKEAVEFGAKEGEKIVGKTVGKSLLKKIPLVGLAIGGAFAVNRMMKGDVAGAGMELASGAVATLPVLGTAASVGIDANIAARDMNKAVDDNMPQLRADVASTRATVSMHTEQRRQMAEHATSLAASSGNNPAVVNRLSAIPGFDPAKAKGAEMQMSGMMRDVMYGQRPGVTQVKSLAGANTVLAPEMDRSRSEAMAM